MPTIDYKPLANGAGALVESQAQFLIDLGVGGSLEDGFQVGIADELQVNKVLRQSSMMTAALANYISNMLAGDVLDDGNLATLITNLTNAIAAQTTTLITSTTSSLSGATGLKRVNRSPVQGTWVNAGPTFNVQANNFALFNGGVNNDGHIISDVNQFGAVNYSITIASSGGAPVYEYMYWNGAAWTALAMLATPTWTNTPGYQQMRFTVPGNWAVGGTGANVPAASYNIRLRATTAPTVGASGFASLSSGMDTTSDETCFASVTGNKQHALATHTNPCISNAAGKNSIDAGVVAASTWYYEYQIYNSTTLEVAGLFSLSSTAPTMPAGFTYKQRVGSVFADANKNIRPMRQTNREVDQVSFLPQLVANSGVQGNTLTPTYVTLDTSLFVPPVATHIKLAYYTSAGVIMVAPRPDYGPYNSTSNIPPIDPFIVRGGDDEIALESSNIFYACDGTAWIWSRGWRENF